MQAKQFEKILVWKSTYVNTIEFTTIKKEKTIKVEGTIIGQGLGNLFHVKYYLDINTDWEIQSFQIDFLSDTSFQLGLHKNNNDQWINNTNEIQNEFNDCVDIDISLTPFTNTLPIKRLDLPVGLSKEIDVIYINLPYKGLKPAKQRYTNLGNGLYKYESLDSGFTANLKVDKDCFVTDYPGIWHIVTSENETELRLKETFFSALFSKNRSPDIDTSLNIYGFLIGSWNVQSIDYLENGKILKQEGEWHFAYVLEGRAIQDIWIAPNRRIRNSNSSLTGNRYGTSFRYLDFASKKWIITWFNPVNGVNNKLIGWKEGAKIIQEGLDQDGNLIRWSFIDITPDSFHWIGELSRDNGKSFILQSEFFGKKI